MTSVKYKGLCTPNLNRRLSAITLHETILKAIDYINMMKSGVIAEILWLNIEKGNGHQSWVSETPRDSKSVQTVKLRDSDIHQSTKFQSKMNSWNYILNKLEQIQKAASTGKAYREAFLSNITPLNWKINCQFVKVSVISAPVIHICSNKWPNRKFLK